MRMTESEEDDNVIKFQSENNGEEKAAEAKLQVKNSQDDECDDNGKN